MGINLCDTNLAGINLSKKNLSYIDFSGSDLSNSKFLESILNNSNLERTYFRDSNLSNAQLQNVKAYNAIFENATLINTDFTNSDLRKSNFKNANLKGAIFRLADLQRSDLTSADLRWANLTQADLSGANLKDARLDHASLNYAKIKATHLLNANMAHVDLQGAIYEPELDGLPKLSTFHSVRNFRGITFNDMEYGRAIMTELLSAYKNLGVHSMQRKIIALMRFHETEKGLEKGGWIGLESAFSYLFFYLTCDYGAAPARPLKIFLGSIFLFTIPYRMAMSWPQKKFSIIVLWTPKRFCFWCGKQKVVMRPLLSKILKTHSTDSWSASIKQQLRLLKVALFFSLSNSFTIGWQYANLANWLMRLQARDCSLQGRGWVQVIAGFQALLGVALITLWILVYFGTPFEW